MGKIIPGRGCARTGRVTRGNGRITSTAAVAWGRGPTEWPGAWLAWRWARARNGPCGGVRAVADVSRTPRFSDGLSRALAAVRPPLPPTPKPLPVWRSLSLMPPLHRQTHRHTRARADRTPHRRRRRRWLARAANAMVPAPSCAVHTA